MYTILIKRDWPMSGGILSRGRYKVPEQLTESMAQRAIRDGVADKSMPVLTKKAVLSRKKRAIAKS